jgi:capsular exopolysaccharide synthesis family protein
MLESGLGAVVWRGKWLIVTTLVVSIAIAIALTKAATPVYQATALLQVNQSGQVGANASDIFNAQQASQNLALTYATEIKSRSFLQRIQPQVIGGSYTVSDLQSLINSSAVANTGLVSITAEGKSPARAQSLARATAYAFLSVLAQDGDAQAAAQQRVVQSRISGLTRLISSLASSAANPGVAAQLASERQALSTMTQQLGSALAGGSLQSTQVSLVGPPTASSSAIRPRPVLNIVAGILLGLLVGVGLAWLRVRLDTGLHSGDEAADILKVPNLASIPQARRSASANPLEDRAVRDAYDVLQTNLRFSSPDRPPEVVVLSSFSAGEGKSSVARGLAEATVHAGESVLVVDGDLRMRSLTLNWGFAGAAGVSTAIGSHNFDGVTEINPGLSFLPAGPPSPSPVSLLYSAQMRQLLDEMRSRYSLIIIDSPPAAHLADASLWASMADGIIVVARVGKTKRAQLTELATKLAATPTPILGAVVFEPRTADLPYGATKKPQQEAVRSTTRGVRLRNP